MITKIVAEGLLLITGIYLIILKADYTNGILCLIMGKLFEISRIQKENNVK